MSRFTGFQSDTGVAVLDTMTGELAFYPFDGATPSVLRPATVESADVPPLGAPPGRTPMESPRARSTADERQVLRSERRLRTPRPLVIRDLGPEEIAAAKAARLTRETGRLSELVLKSSRAVLPTRPDSSPEDEE